MSTELVEAGFRGYSMARTESRFVPLLGALSVVLVAAGFVVAGDSPTHHATGAEIRDAYDSETQHQIAAFLVALGAIPLLFFAGYLRAVLARLRPATGLSANVAFAGAVVMATGLGLQSLMHAAVAEAAQTPEFSDEALQPLNALEGWSFYPFAIGLSTFLLAGGAALVRDRDFLAPVLGRAAIALGVLTFVPIVGFFAAVPSAVWIVALSVILFAREQPGRGTTSLAAGRARGTDDDQIELAGLEPTEAVGHVGRGTTSSQREEGTR